MDNLCDCRRPAPDRATIDLNQDAVQCEGCRQWITGMMVLTNRWGFTQDEIKAIFRGSNGQD